MCIIHSGRAPVNSSMGHLVVLICPSMFGIIISVEITAQHKGRTTVQSDLANALYTKSKKSRAIKAAVVEKGT